MSTHVSKKAKIEDKASSQDNDINSMKDIVHSFHHDVSKKMKKIANDVERQRNEAWAKASEADKYKAMLLLTDLLYDHWNNSNDIYIYVPSDAISFTKDLQIIKKGFTSSYTIGEPSEKLIKALKDCGITLNVTKDDDFTRTKEIKTQYGFTDTVHLVKTSLDIPSYVKERKE